MKTATPSIQNMLTLKTNSDAIVGLAVVAMLLVMLIPMPAPILDILIALNITLSVVVLLISLYVMEPIAFSVFPTLLLLLTLFRLALNIASTRLILLDGSSGTAAAGKVIESFGQFVVGGNYVVGAVIFLVIVAIQYIVVNHGAVRISEVTARFTLDAMPGKQMSIDADLNAGLIDENEARDRRKQINREAEFYGAMDGAVRFTSRDAIASIIITAINIIAGFMIGVLQVGMPLVDALKTFTVLTIGDGLVTAIPSLFVSVTGGIMTTRAASESGLGSQFSMQLFRDYRPMALTALTLLVLALVPGLPFLAFFLLSLGAGLMAWVAHRGAEPEVELLPDQEAESAKKEERVENLMKVDALGLELGYQLIQLVDNREGADFLSRVKSVRRQLALELGIVVPPIHITDNLQLRPREYRILLKGVEVARSELLPECLMAINPGVSNADVEGIATQEPTFNLPALWIRPEHREKAQLVGYTVVDNTTVLATHLTEVIKSHVHELLGRQEVKSLIDPINESHPKVIEELIPKLLSVGQVQKVLQNLLRERVSIRDMVTILEALADYAPLTRNTALLTEYVRQSLGRSICQPHLSERGELMAFTLSAGLEKIFSDAVTVAEQDSYLVLDPETARGILPRFQKAIEKGSFEGYPVLLTSTAVRLHVKRFTEHLIPSLVVVSHNEVPPKVRLISIGVIE
jgi:flagellar biosynthesis protein FlhA